MARAACCWLAAAGLLMALAAWIGADGSAIVASDRAALALAHAWRRPWLDQAFLALTWLGSLRVLLPLVAVAGVAAWRRGLRREAGFLVTAVLGAALLARLAKELALRPRPELFAALAPDVSPWAFPSVHAAQATAVAVAAWIIIGRLAPRWRPAAACGLATLVALVGVSRIYLQLHYPSDIVAGMFAAACWVAGLNAVMPRADATRRD